MSAQSGDLDTARAFGNSSSPHWFHNLWFDVRAALEGNSFSGSVFGSAARVSAPERRPGPLLIHFSDSDFSFARITLNAERIELPKPRYLDLVPPAYFGEREPSFETGARHPLLSQPSAFRAEPAANSALSWADVGPHKALHLFERTATGYLSLEFPDGLGGEDVWKLAVSVERDTDFQLRFDCDGATFFIPFDEDTETPYDKGVRLSGRFYHKLSRDVAGERILFITFNRSMFSRHFSLHEPCTNLRISTEHLAPARSFSSRFSAGLELKLLAADFMSAPASEPEGVNLLGGFLEPDDSDNYRYCATPDGRLYGFYYGQVEPRAARGADAQRALVFELAPFGLEAAVARVLDSDGSYAEAGLTMEVTRNSVLARLPLAMSLAKVPSPTAIELQTGFGTLRRDLGPVRLPASPSFVFSGQRYPDVHSPGYANGKGLFSGFGGPHRLEVLHDPERGWFAYKMTLGGFSGLAVNVPGNDTVSYPDARRDVLGFR
ncbi:MAG: hypothetical protein U5N86_11815 [Planctomycetota bacterium]|nr:hypothetical protein [Planctomycetota bacterium]